MIGETSRPGRSSLPRANRREDSLTSAQPSDPRPPRLLPRRRVWLLTAAAGAAAILALVIVARPPGATRTSSAPSIASSASAGNGGLIGPGLGLPELDPVPWTAVEWRVLPGAITVKPVVGLDRIDGLVAGGPGLIGWGRVRQPGRNQFNDMGAIHLSPNGIDWTVVPLDTAVGPADASEFQLVSDGPAGLLVLGNVCCTGEERPAAWLSQEGITWQRIPVPADIAAAQLTKLVATRDRYVLAGQLNGRARIWASADGVAWRTAGDPDEGLGRGSVEDVARTKTGLVASGRVEDDQGRYDGALWSSTDGVTWTRDAVPLLEVEAHTIVSRAVPWSAGLLLIGNEGDHDERIRCEQAGSSGPIQPPRPGSRDFVCGWGSETHWVQRDGQWQRVIPAGAQAGPKAHAGELIEFRLVTAGGPGLVTLGEGLDDGGASIFASDDGVTWQPTAPRPQWKNGIVPSGFVVQDRTIVAVGDGPTVQIGSVR